MLPNSYYLARKLLQSITREYLKNNHIRIPTEAILIYRKWEHEFYIFPKIIMDIAWATIYILMVSQYLACIRTLLTKRLRSSWEKYYFELIWSKIFPIRCISFWNVCILIIIFFQYQPIQHRLGLIVATKFRIIQRSNRRLIMFCSCSYINLNIINMIWVKYNKRTRCLLLIGFYYGRVRVWERERERLSAGLFGWRWAAAAASTPKQIRGTGWADQIINKLL